MITNSKIGDHFLTSFQPTCLHCYFTSFIN